MSFFKKIAGIHLERKKLTRYLNIERLDDVPYIKLPLIDDLKKVVLIGSKVKKGQLIAEGEVSPSLHSPVSGKIEEVLHFDKNRHGFQEVIVIKNDFEENSAELFPIKDFKNLDFDNFVLHLKSMGIVGMGGAGYPTYLKIQKAFDKGVRILVVNACECEPYLNCDNRLIQEKSKEIVEGIDILVKILKLDLAVIAIEDNKREAIMELKKALKNQVKIQLNISKSIYPLGEERILIKELFDTEIPLNRSPIEYGYLVQNVATIFAIYEAAVLGRATIERVITVAGFGVEENKNLRIKIGTPIDYILDTLGFNNNTSKIVLGGPMTGQSLFSQENSLLKNHNALLFLTNEEINPKKTEPCIYCGLCVDKCPVGLIPLRFEEFLSQNETENLLLSNINDCIDCGICSYICPSNRPLLEAITFGKKIIKEV